MSTSAQALKRPAGSRSHERRLRIAFIGARGVGASYSGIETYYEEVGSRLAARGHDVTAYCRRYFTPKGEFFRGIRVRRVPCIRTAGLETLSHTAVCTLDSLMRGFDVVQFHALGAALFVPLPRLAGVRTVASVRGLDWQRDKWGGVARRVLRAGEWSAARLASRTVVVSETLGRHFTETHGREPVVIPNPVLRRSPPAWNLAATTGLVPEGYVLYAGRLSTEKNVHILIEAMRQLPAGIDLAIAGDAGYDDAYARRLRDLADDRVKFLGRVEHELALELMAHSRLFVLPSDLEGLSIALLEAVSLGCCIVASDIPENREVAGEAAIYTPPRDTTALAKALAVAIEPKERDRLRSSARRRADQLPDWDEIADRTEDLYLQLRAEKSPEAVS